MASTLKGPFAINMVSIQLSADSSDETKGKFINELVAECKEILKSNHHHYCLIQLLNQDPIPTETKYLLNMCIPPKDTHVQYQSIVYRSCAKMTGVQGYSFLLAPFLAFGPPLTNHCLERIQNFHFDCLPPNLCLERGFIVSDYDFKTFLLLWCCFIVAQGIVLATSSFLC